MLGTVASGAKPSLADARKDMVTIDAIQMPDLQMQQFHSWKFHAYRTLQDTERQLWADRPSFGSHETEDARR